MHMITFSTVEVTSAIENQMSFMNFDCLSIDIFIKSSFSIEHAIFDHALFVPFPVIVYFF